MEPATLAKYPFLPQARRWAKDQGPDVRELLTDVAWRRAVERGVERVESALEDAEVAPSAAASEQEHVLEVLSYAVARMAVSAVDNSYLTRRYALGEAKAAQRYLEGEGVLGLLEVARRLGLDVERRDGELGMHVTSYLAHLKGVREDRRRLVNQRLDAGYVLLDESGFARMVQEAVRSKILDELPRPTGPVVQEALGEQVARIDRKAEALAKELKPEPLGEVRLELIPPCMESLLGRLQAGENVPHQGRFALTAFLHEVGMGSEEIMELFAAAPDFKEDVTRYQVEHITGRGGGEGYTPPACATMVTYGLCVNKDALCEHINHPLSYYRVKYRDNVDDEDAEDEADDQDEETAETPAAGGEADG